MEMLVRCIIPHRVSLGQRWHMVQHKKYFPKGFPGLRRGGYRSKE